MLKHVPFVLILVGCSASLTQQAIATAEAVAQCVSPIVLDVTGMATEDPVQIAQACGVAVSDVYNFVTAEIAAAEGDASVQATTKGAASPVYVGTHGRYYSQAQFDKLHRIQAAAKAHL